MCSKKESKVPALFFSTCKSKRVWSSLNSSSENTMESRSWGALWRVAKGLLCKVEFPTCFLVNIELFPIWLALRVGWFQLQSQPHLRLLFTLMVRTFANRTGWFAEAEESTWQFVHLSNHHRTICSTRSCGVNLWNFFPLTPVVVFHRQDLWFSPQLLNLLHPSFFLPNSLVFQILISLFLLSPAILSCYSR